MEFYSKTLNAVKVLFKDKKYNYTTSVSRETTKEDAEKYFIGRVYRHHTENEKITKNDLCIGIIFYLNPNNKGLKGATIGTRAIAKAISITGLKKSDGTLKKGYKYKKVNGKTKIVKVAKKPTKKVVKKTKPKAKK